MKILILISRKHLSYFDKIKISSLQLNNEIFYMDINTPKVHDTRPFFFKLILGIEFFIYRLLKNTFSIKNFRISGIAKKYSENETKIDLIFNVNIDDHNAIKIKNNLKSILLCYKNIDVLNKKNTDFFNEIISKTPTIKSCFYVSRNNETDLYEFQSIEIQTYYLSILNQIRLEKAINDILQSIIIKINNNTIINDNCFHEKNVNSYDYELKDLIKYFLNILSNLILIKFKKSDEFLVGYISTKNFYNKKFDSVSFLEPPKGNYFADPFIVENDNRKFIFHEEYSKNKKGIISATEITNGINKYLGTVLEEKFHLSFPYIFIYKGQYYMVPETNEDNSIKLYKCVDFPMKWEFQHNLMSNIDCADTIIIQKEGFYWIITSEFLVGYHNNYNIFYSSSPISKDWKQHTLNPIKIQNDSRSGGLISFENETILVNQSFDFLGYGDHVNYKSISKISPIHYEEKSFGLKNDQFLNVAHHMSNSNNFIVFDKKSKLK